MTRLAGKPKYPSVTIVSTSFGMSFSLSSDTSRWKTSTDNSSEFLLFTIFNAVGKFSLSHSIFFLVPSTALVPMSEPIACFP